MITPEQFALIRRLFFAEHWKTGTIANELGLHWNTIQAALETHRFNQREAPRKQLTDKYLPFIRETLALYPRLRATRIFEMIRGRGYAGSVVQLRRIVAKLRPGRREAFLCRTVLPGEEAQVDWASFGQIVIGRAKRRLACFTAILSFSRLLWMEFFFDQTIENFLLGHIHAFEYWQGVPRTILTDNLKSVVLERQGDAIRFHPRILELSARYHFDPRPCRPARGNEKGRIERAIQHVRHAFFAARPFTSLEDFNRQARQWLDGTASQRPWPGGGQSTVREAFERERGLLLPLPLHPFDSDTARTVSSRKTIYVRFGLNDYSIPPEAVGRPLTLIASQTEVRILDGAREIARHRRSYDRGRLVEDPVHLDALLKEKRKALGSSAAGRLVQSGGV